MVYLNSVLNQLKILTVGTTHVFNESDNKIIYNMSRNGEVTYADLAPMAQK